MLEGLDLTRPLAQWEGHYFYAQVGIMENQEFDVNFCACDNGISFVFPMEHWKSIQNLFRRALAVARRDAGVGHVGVGIWRDVSEAVLCTGRMANTPPLGGNCRETYECSWGTILASSR